VLSQVLSVTSVFKHKLERARETLVGHLKSAGRRAACGPQAAGWTALSYRIPKYFTAL